MAQSVKNFGRLVQPERLTPSSSATYIIKGIFRACQATLFCREATHTFDTRQKPGHSIAFARPTASKPTPFGFASASQRTSTLLPLSPGST
jgi:hypothetical protein